MRDLTQVNGVKVEARERAKYTEDSRPSPLVKPGTEVPSVDEVLLADGTVIFQCVHPSSDDCVYTNTNLRSVTAHQVAHGKRRIEREAREATQRAAAAEAELNERKQRRSEGSRKGHLTRVATRTTPASVPVEVGGRGGVKVNGKEASSAIGDAELAKQAQRVITAWNALQECTNEFQNVFIGYMRMAQTASVPPAIDPQILAKAKQYDELKKKLFDV